MRRLLPCGLIRDGEIYVYICIYMVEQRVRAEGGAEDMGLSNLVRGFQLAQQDVDLRKRIGLRDRGLFLLHAGHSWTRMQRARDGSGALISIYIYIYMYLSASNKRSRG